MMQAIVPTEQNPLTTHGAFTPTLDEMRWWRDSLTARFNQADEDEGSLDDQQRWDEDLYFQHFAIESPQGKHIVRTGSAPADADSAIDSLTPTDIQVRVRPARNRENHRKRAEKLAHFGRAVVTQWRRKKDVFRICAGNQVIRHVGIMRVLFDDRLWPQPPPGTTPDDDWAWKNRRKWPIIAESRNPRYVRWRELPTGELLAVSERYTFAVAEARLMFSAYPRAWGILAGRQANDTVTFDDIWVGRHRCVLLDDQPVFGEEGVGDGGVILHPYGPEPPYVIVPFRELDFDNPGRRYRGMLSNAAGLYEIESQVLTMHVWQLAWNSWRTWIGHFADPSRKLEIVPGMFIDVDKDRGEYLMMLQGEPVPPEILGTASVIDSYIQRNGVTQGPRTQEGTRSAQQVWAIQSIRQLKVEPGKQDLQRGTERMLTITARILQTCMPNEKITLPVPGKDQEGNPVGEVTITSADLDGYEESFDVTFGRRLDPALLEQAKSVMGLAVNQWMPLKVSWELSGLTDSPEEWEDALNLQKVDQMDFMAELTGYEQVVAQYGEESWRTQLYKQRMQNPPPVGRNGRRNNGLGPPPGMLQPTALPSGPAPGASMGQGMQQVSRANGRMPAPSPVPAGGMPGQTAPQGPLG